MAMHYSLPVRNARMGIVRDRLNGGSLKLLGKVAGVMKTLAEFQLEKDSGRVSLGELLFNGFPKFSMAMERSKIEEAVLCAADGEVVVSGLSVDIAGAEVVMDTVEVTPNNIVRISGAAIRHA